MNKLNIISIIILCIIIGSLIIFHIKYVAQFDFNTFMYNYNIQLQSKDANNEIEWKTYKKISNEFQKLFDYYDKTFNLNNTFYTFISLFVMLFTIIAMIISVILQFCNKCIIFKNCGIIFTPIFSLIYMIVYFKFAFESEYKVNLTEGYIYIYDDKFNKEIENNLDYMYNRKIYLIACVFLATIGIIAQLIIGIIDMINKENKIPEQLLQNNDQDDNNEKQN